MYKERNGRRVNVALAQALVSLIVASSGLSCGNTTSNGLTSRDYRGTWCGAVTYNYSSYSPATVSTSNIAFTVIGTEVSSFQAERDITYLSMTTHGLQSVQCPVTFASTEGAAIKVSSFNISISASFVSTTVRGTFESPVLAKGTIDAIQLPETWQGCNEASVDVVGEQQGTWTASKSAGSCDGEETNGGNDGQGGAAVTTNTATGGLGGGAGIGGAAVTTNTATGGLGGGAGVGGAASTGGTDQGMNAGGADSAGGVGTAAAEPVCGDGLPASGEECDDHNGASGDGCSSTCSIELGFVCPAFGEACVSAVPRIVCGNQLVESGETCDDGNALPGDGCSGICALEDGWQCPIPGSSCTRIAYCGDGLLNGTEQCDDGNTRPGDCCNGLCMLEANCTCVTPIPLPDPPHQVCSFTGSG